VGLPRVRREPAARQASVFAKAIIDLASSNMGANHGQPAEVSA
jgi:hypothetical protein